MKSLVVSITALLPLVAHAYEPLAVTNLSTLARGFALPVLGWTQILGAERERWRGHLDVTNEFYFDTRPTETLRLDGETTRYSLAYTRGLGEGLEVGAELPVYLQGGGVLDEVVDGFHETFGYSDAGRDQFPQRQYVFSYQRAGVSLLDVRRGGQAVGDLSLNGGWQLSPRAALRGTLKLPVGAVSKLAGNGAASAAAWVDAQMPWLEQWDGLSGFLSAGSGYHFLGDVLPGQQERWVLFGGGGLAWKISPVTTLMAQAYAHGPLFKDSLYKTLSGEALILSFGARWRLADNAHVDWTVIEDAYGSPAPDFSMRFGLDWGR